MSLLRSIKAQLGLMSGGNESQNHFWDGSVANQLTLKRGVPDAPGCARPWAENAVSFWRWFQSKTAQPK